MDGGLVLGLVNSKSVSNSNHVVVTVGDLEEGVGVKLVNDVGDDFVLLEAFSEGGGNSNLG